MSCNDEAIRGNFDIISRVCHTDCDRKCEYAQNYVTIYRMLCNTSHGTGIGILRSKPVTAQLSLGQDSKLLVQSDPLIHRRSASANSADKLIADILRRNKQNALLI